MNTAKRARTKRLLRTGDAAFYLNLSENKLRALGTRGVIPYVRDYEGAPWLWDVRDLDGWIERNKRTVIT